MRLCGCGRRRQTATTTTTTMREAAGGRQCLWGWKWEQRGQLDKNVKSLDDRWRIARAAPRPVVEPQPVVPQTLSARGCATAGLCKDGSVDGCVGRGARAARKPAPAQGRGGEGWVRASKAKGKKKNQNRKRLKHVPATGWDVSGCE